MKNLKTVFTKNITFCFKYEYVDGRFIPSLGFKPTAMAVVNANKAASLHGEPWYQEVVELRKQAQDYKVSF